MTKKYLPLSGAPPVLRASACRSLLEENAGLHLGESLAVREFWDFLWEMAPPRV